MTASLLQNLGRNWSEGSKVMRKQGKECKYIEHPVAQAWLHLGKKNVLSKPSNPSLERVCSQRKRQGRGLISTDTL